MRKLKVMTIVGTRPEIIRLSRIIPQLDSYCEHTLVHSGQNYDYELSEVFFNDLGIRKPDVFLNAARDTPAETIGQVIICADQAIQNFQPEALLLLGDTNSCLSAIAAKRRKVPIFHMEAGNRCFDTRVPEEINRKIIDHISDINLTYTEIAREYLIREGIPPDQIIRIGSPMREVLAHYAPHIKSSDILERLSLSPQSYFLASVHREENVDHNENLIRVIDILNELAKQYQQPVIVSTHPRTRNKIARLNKATHPLVCFLKPFGFFDYIKLQTEAKCVLSDSGTITEESSILNFPALNLRETHERPEGFEEAAVMLTGLSIDRVLQALSIIKNQARGDVRDLTLVKDYTPQNVSKKVLRIIQSYTDYINRKTWHKNN